MGFGEARGDSGYLRWFPSSRDFLRRIRSSPVGFLASALLGGTVDIDGEPWAWRWIVRAVLTEPALLAFGLSVAGHLGPGGARGNVRRGQ